MSPTEITRISKWIQILMAILVALKEFIPSMWSRFSSRKRSRR